MKLSVLRNGSEILLSWLMVKIYLLIHPRMIPIWFNRFYSCSLILSNNCCNKEQVKKFMLVKLLFCNMYYFSCFPKAL